MSLLVKVQGNCRLLFILLGFVLLAACGSQEERVTEAVETGDDESELLQTTIIGGRTGGAWSVFTEGIAESIRRKNESAVITVEPGGIVENPPTVGLGKIPYGLSYAMTSYAAYMGNEPYKKPYKDLRAVSVVIPANYYQFIVSADAGYDSIKQIIENQAPIKLAVDQKGSAGEIITRQILQAYGISYDDIISWGGSVDHLSGSKTFELMADHRIDVTADAVSVPSSDILEASTTIDLSLLSLEEDIIQTVSDELGMTPGTIATGSYDFLTKDISTINTPAILLVHKDVPADEVYRVVRAIYENFDYLATVHEEFKNLSDENIAEVGQVPLHPGAAKFFKEKGLIDLPK